MPGTWPEPFGLAAIEALACGTPVLTRRVGALPEIVRDGVDGFFGDDVDHLAFLVDRVDRLDRAGIRASVLERFSAGRMTGDYEALYRRTLARAAVEAAGRALSGPGSAPPPVAVGPGRPDPTAVPSAAVPPVAADAPAEFVIPPTHRALDDAAPPSRDAAGDRSARIETLDGAGSS
jgi:hypothetical protein